MEMTVKRVGDFEVTGDGSDQAWQAVDWQTLGRVGEGQAQYATRGKVAYSKTGMYFLFECEDQKLTCTMTRDFDDIYHEDVIEVFLWTDESEQVYFEYEISPLGVELPILVSNHQGTFHGWLPWHFEGGRKTRTGTSVKGGTKASGASVEAWTAEFFIPFALFQGLGGTPPVPGTKWRANLYRIDYDAGPASHWAWCPDTGANFHSFRQFGTLVFGE